MSTFDSPTAELLKAFMYIALGLIPADFVIFFSIINLNS